MSEGAALPGAAGVADVVRSALQVEPPVAGLILGSGLGGLAARIEDARSIPYADLPGFARPTVPGHAGRLIAGRLAGRRK